MTKIKTWENYDYNQVWQIIPATNSSDLKCLIQNNMIDKKHDNDKNMKMREEHEHEATMDNYYLISLHMQ